MNALELKNISKTYDGFSLQDISFALPQGNIMGFIGENGAGKTTTIKIMLDIVHKNSGEVYFWGKNLAEGKTQHHQDIGVVLDEAFLPECLCVLDINKIMVKIYKNWEKQVFIDYLQKFRLPDKKQIKDFSKGMKMKLSIAIALAHKAKLLILDEATSGLDPVAREEILDVFLEFIQEETHSIFISSHIISDLEKICDYITFIHEGKLLFSQPKDVLLEKYGVLKCTETQIATIDKDLVYGVRKNSFGVEALVDRQRLRGEYVVDPAGIEEIMLYFIKGGGR